MRFLNDGPEIPDDLLNERDKDGVLFIAGAGVSRPAGLPNFEGLVTKIYTLLNERYEDQPAEQDAFKYEEYDRVLYALRRRLHKQSDPTDDDLILQKLRKILRKPRGAILERHLDILRLSLDARGQTPRLVTTNFDTLFEETWYQKARNKIDSWAGPALPGVKTARFRGVIHLHGRLVHRKLKIPESELVLTSAEFGEAYLRSGWATRYVYDLARAYTLILVGYGLNDPPMRYLLEVVAADRDRFKDLKSVYAFVAFDLAKDDPKKVGAIWREGRCVEPIMYPTTALDDHRSLYDTLHVWAARAENPTLWIQQQISKLAIKKPSELAEWELNHILSLIRTEAGAAAFAALGRKAPVEWLSVPEFSALMGEGA
jgi:hypothetical protein